MNFRELNSFVDIFMANVNICAQKLWEYQREGFDVTILDLRSAYLKLHVHKSL